MNMSHKPMDTVLSACERDELELLQRLVRCNEFRRSINVKEREVYPLEYACRENGMAFVDTLLKSGAKDTIEDAHGNKPIHIACKRKVDSTKKVKLLVKQNKENINRRNRRDDTPLILACIAGKTDTVKFLIQNGADMDAIDESGHFLLERAAYYDLSEIIYTAILNGANVNQADIKTGNTSLHIAANFGSFKAVQALTSNPYCDVNIRNKRNQTALDIAQSKPESSLALQKHPEIAEHLQKLKSEKDPKYKIALQWDGLEREWELFLVNLEHIDHTAIQKLTNERQRIKGQLNTESDFSTHRLC